MLELLMEPMLTVTQVAQRLNVSDATVRRWLRTGLLSGLQVGNEWRVERADLEAFIRTYKRPKKERG